MNGDTPRYLFHAHAIGLSGHITRPFEELIDVQAASALPPTGGLSSGRKRSYRLRGILTHQGAHSKATGSFNRDTKANETLATATVQGFNLCDTVVADDITARITSVHLVGGEHRITPQGSAFLNLRIAGRVIELEDNVDVFHELDTLEKVRDHYRNNTNDFRTNFDRQAYAGEDAVLPENKRRYFRWFRHGSTGELPVCKGGFTIVPLFKVKNPSAPGFEVHGNVISVENFGRIILGELIISGDRRRLTMLHVDLGSPTEGAVTAAAAEGNGGTTDP
jgi:hypothetical protein